MSLLPKAVEDSWKGWLGVLLYLKSHNILKKLKLAVFLVYFNEFVGSSTFVSKKVENGILISPYLHI